MRERRWTDKTKWRTSPSEWKPSNGEEGAKDVYFHETSKHNSGNRMVNTRTAEHSYEASLKMKHYVNSTTWSTSAVSWKMSLMNSSQDNVCLHYLYSTGSYSKCIHMTLLADLIYIIKLWKITFKPLCKIYSQYLLFTNDIRFNFLCNDIFYSLCRKHQER